MEFRSDESGARSSGMLAEPASMTVVELDLYDELSSFSALSPQQQRKELERVALLLGAQPSLPTGAEEQQKEPERVAMAAAQPAPAVEEQTPAGFDFIESSDLPIRDGPELDRPAGPAFNLIDGPLFEPPDVSDLPPPQSVFAFVEEPAQEASTASEDDRFASETPVTLGVTSPLADMLSGASPALEAAQKCESCGAGSIAEDLFCLSCGELVGEINW